MSSYIKIPLNKSSSRYKSTKKKIESLLGKSIIKKYNSGMIEATVNDIHNIISNIKIPKFKNYKKDSYIISGLDIKENKEIAKGGYGTIVRANILNKDNSNVIIKFQTIRESPAKVRSLIYEIIIQILLRSNQNIYKYIPKYYTTFKKNNQIGIVMEDLGGYTLDIAIKNNLLNHIKLYSILLQLSIILELFQRNYKFMHGDLKLNNIMILKTDKEKISININKKNYTIKTYGYTIKIIDFGFSCIISENNSIISTSTYYDNSACNKKYIDLLFFTISLCKKLSKYSRNNIGNRKLDILLYILKERINKFLYELKIVRGKYLGIKGNSNKNKILIGDKYIDFSMFEEGNDIGDLYYDIIDLCLKINKNENKINKFKMFYPLDYYYYLKDNKDIIIK